MRYNIILGIIIISLSILISSCKNEKEVKKENKSEVIASDTVFNSQNPYYIFIQKHNPEALKENELIYFKEEDIDLDGKKEAIVALGVINENLDKQANVKQIFLLRNDNGTIKKLENDYDYLFLITGVELVSLEGIKQKFICLDIIKGGSSHGFMLLELNGNRASEFFYITPFGEGSCYLIDKNEDGKYDGYTKFFWFNDTVGYEVEESFVFKNNKFVPSETHVKISDYPTDIEELILQYISLRSLRIPESSEVKQRLEQICTDQDAPAINWKKDVWAESCSKYYEESEKSTELVIQEENNTAIVTYTDEDQKQYQLQFEIEKSNNKWQISKVEVIR